MPAPARAEVRLIQHGFVVWGTPDPIVPERYVTVSEPVPLPHEFVFREVWDLELPSDWREMDDSATTDVLAFAYRHGALWRPYPPLAREAVVGSSGDRAEELWAMRQRMWSFGTPVNHLADMLAWLRDLQRCARHLVAEIEDDYTAEVWDAKGPSHSSGHGQTSAADELMAQRSFVWALNQGLRQYCDGVEADEALVGETIDRSSEVDLYGASCLMIRSIIRADARLSLKRCHNDRCNRPFIRQLPEAAEEGSAQRQRSGGVKYCSTKCKDAAAQRRRYHRLAPEGPGTPAQLAASDSGAPEEVSTSEERV